MAKYQYVAKLDVRKYFDNISHDILLQKLTRLFKDKRLMIVFEKIIRSYNSGIHNPNSLVKCDKGVPIGNLTSQYFANYYLSQNDHFIKEQLYVPFYVRYMDDMLLMGNDKKVLKQQLQIIGLAQKTVSDDPLVNRESSCVSFLETENEQCYIAQHPILVGIPEAFSNNSDVIFRNNLN